MQKCRGAGGSMVAQHHYAYIYWGEPQLHCLPSLNYRKSLLSKGSPPPTYKTGFEMESLLFLILVVWMWLPLSEVLCL